MSPGPDAGRQKPTDIYPGGGRRLVLSMSLGLLFLFLLLMLGPGSRASAAPSRQATVVSTVTGTPSGPFILVPDEVNVRACPSVDCELVGVLISGQTAPALGRTPGGDWIQINYVGVPGNTAWVYAPLVRIEGAQGFLPVVEPPATPTPRVTATIDPTLAAQFSLGAATPTRLPTFTPAAPVIQPTFESPGANGGGGFPPILAILGLLVVGLFGTVISFLRGT